MVKGIVEMHGGTASVESDGAGRGTEFTVRLPLDLAGRAEAGRAIPLPVEERRQRVLIVEDNVDAAGTLRDVLELRGHTVAVAFSAADGMEKARAFTPDVVLCDIGLPGMSGYEVARAMRRDPALARTRLVALSGYAAPRTWRVRGRPGSTTTWPSRRAPSGWRPSFAPASAEERPDTARPREADVAA